MKVTPRRFLCMLAISLGLAQQGHAEGIGSVISNATKLLETRPSISLFSGNDDIEAEDAHEGNHVALESACDELAALSEDEITQVMQKLLKPAPGQYVPLRLLESVFHDHTPANAWHAKNASDLNLALRSYVEFHGDTLQRQPLDPTLRAYLEIITNQIHAHWFLYFQLEADQTLVRELAKSNHPQGIPMRQVWVPQPKAPDDDGLFHPSDWVAQGKWLAYPHDDTESNGGILAVDLEQGTERWLRSDKIKTLQKLVPATGSKEDSQVLLIGHELIEWFDLETETVVRSARRPHSEYWSLLSTAGGHVFLGWSAPPHYFGALEREPKLARDPAYLKRLNTSLHVLSAGRETFAHVKAADNEWQRDEIESMTCSTSGRWVGILKDRDRSFKDPHVSPVFASTSPSCEKLEMLGKVPDAWVPMAWNGHPDEVLLLAGKTIEHFNLDETQPGRMLSLDLQSKRLRLLWSLDKKSHVLKKWIATPFQEPTETVWKLPLSFALPRSGEKLEWLGTVTHNGDIIALCARLKVGRELVPQHSLLVFREGLESAVEVPVQFPLGERGHAFISSLVKKGIVNPSREDQANYVLRASQELVVASYYGIWSMSWKELDSHIAQAVGER